MVCDLELRPGSVLCGRPRTAANETRTETSASSVPKRFSRAYAIHRPPLLLPGLSEGPPSAPSKIIPCISREDSDRPRRPGLAPTWATSESARCARVGHPSSERCSLGSQGPGRALHSANRTQGRSSGPGSCSGFWSAAEMLISSELGPTLDQMILSSFSVSSYGPNISSRPTWYRPHPKPSTRIGPMTRNF